MTIDVEDYFHVSVFDGVVPRAGLGRRSRAASCAQHRAAAGRCFAEHERARRRSSCWAGSPSGFRDLVKPHRRGRPRDRLARLRPSARLRPDAGRRSARTCGAPRRCSRTPAGGRGARLSRAELLDHAAVALGARRPDRGGLQLRREHLSRSGTIATASPSSPRHPYSIARAQGSIRRGARHRRRGSARSICRSPAAATSACCRTGGRAGASIASTGSNIARRSSTCTRGRSIRTSRGSRPDCSAASVTTGICVRRSLDFDSS